MEGALLAWYPARRRTLIGFRPRVRLGGDGTAAILGMLQTCSPGLSVVNVDNGVGAGATAALIANRAAAGRTASENGRTSNPV